MVEGVSTALPFAAPMPALDVEVLEDGVVPEWAWWEVAIGAVVAGGVGAAIGYFAVSAIIAT